LGFVFVFIGPGGAGKNAILKALLAQCPRLQQLATATTRPMRDGEAHGREHLFLDCAQFKRMLAQGELLEHQEITPGKFYGIPRRTVEAALAAGTVLLADIDVRGAQALARSFPENVVQLFVTVPGSNRQQQLAILRQRMLARADSHTDIEQRLQRAAQVELPYQQHCEYVLVNDCLEQAISQAHAILQRELSVRARA